MFFLTEFIISDIATFLAFMNYWAAFSKGMTSFTSWFIPLHIWHDVCQWCITSPVLITKIKRRVLGECHADYAETMYHLGKVLYSFSASIFSSLFGLTNMWSSLGLNYSIMVAYSLKIRFYFEYLKFWLVSYRSS